MTEEIQNPWHIQSIYELQYFICPSCTFKDHSKQEIINHTYEFHPDCIQFLSNITDNSLHDIVCPWIEPKTEIKEEYVEESELADDTFNYEPYIQGG